MRWFLNMKLRMKLILGFAVVTLLTICLGTFALIKLAAVRATTVDMSDNWLASVRYLGDMRTDISDMRRLEFREALAKTDDDRTRTMNRIDEAAAKFQKDAKVYEPTIGDPEEQKIYERITAAFGSYLKLQRQAAALFQQGQTDAAADVVMGAGKPAYDGVADAVQDDIDYNHRGAGRATKQSEELYESARLAIVGVIAICVAMSLGLAFFLSRMISQPVQDIGEIAQMIAGGDLTHKELAIESKDEIGALGRDINRMQESLREIILTITDNARQMAAASEEISATASQQALGAKSQTDQTHQVAVAMQEMASTVNQVAEHSNRASEASRKAAETARHGGEIVEDALAKMNAIADSVGQTAQKVQELGKSSNQIGEIIRVIDDIADQTNLLALNAAIEAARAGESGRGFAVVADEVRKLAERTSKATQQITAMIQAIQSETLSAVEAMETGTKQVQLGVESTTQAGSSLQEIIQTAEEVGDMVTQIATAATEQSRTTEEINTNIDQIAKISQESAIGSAESAKAVQELSSLALSLDELVGKFRVEANGRKPKSTQLALRRQRGGNEIEVAARH